MKNIGDQYFEQSREFDPENKYSVPYCFGTVGILYNKTMVDEPVDSCPFSGMKNTQTAF